MLQVRVPGYALDFPKDQLRAVFPNSLLANAAEYEGGIDLTQPFIAPSLLQLLQQIVTTGQIPAVISTDIDYVKASTYLNIPVLTALADPWFPTYRFLNSAINTVPIAPLLQDEITYLDMLRLAVSGEAALILWYLIQSVEPTEKTAEIEAATFVRAAHNGVTSIVRVMLPRVNPQTAVIAENTAPDLINKAKSQTARNLNAMKTNQALGWALFRNYSEIVALLLADPRVHLEAIVYYILAYGNESNLNFQRLLLRPETTSDFLTLILDHIDGSSDPAQMVYSHPNFVPGDQAYENFADSIQNFSSIDYARMASSKLIADLIYWNPRADPNRALRQAFISPEGDPLYIPYLEDFFEEWISDPRLNPDQLPDSFLGTMMWLCVPRILTAFVQKYPQMKPKLRALAQQGPPLVQLFPAGKEDVEPVAPNSPQVVAQLLA